MEGEEDVEDHLARDDVGVEVDAHDLGVARVAAAYVLVGRVGGAPARVTGFDAANASEVAEHGIEAPEAAAAQDGGGGWGFSGHGSHRS